MATATNEAEALRDLIDAHRDAVLGVMARYGASNPRLFGSVARGDATAASDVDVFVDLDPADGNPLLRVAGIGEEISRILGTRVDVVTSSLLRESVERTALDDAVAL
ncbi:MAG TPA: nucleotidyltransferase domain-containing protein [Agromyces sp.]|nr:nucleotidyltransferase domain-containing protein [Agromyces sp.]